MPLQSRILVIDGTSDNLSRLTSIFESAGFGQVRGVTDSDEALAAVREFEPILLVLDLTSESRKNFEVLRRLSALPNSEFLPSLVVTRQGDHATLEAAMMLGATDFITYPYLPFDVVLRTRNLLQTRRLQFQLQERNRLLESKVAKGNEGLQIAQSELKAAQLDVIERLAMAGEHHDDDTGAHTRRVANTCRRIAQALGLSPQHVELIFRAAPLHDVGKIGISDSILLKPGKLTPEEFHIMKSHCELGAQLLSDGRSDFLETARTIALTHHERYDGTGYPLGLKGEEIPLEGRIVAVADVYDALTNERPYKHAWTVEEARAEIERQKGRQFDPRIVDVFLGLEQ